MAKAARERTPITEADAVINEVARLFQVHTGTPAETFKAKYVEAIAGDPTATGARMLKRVKDETALLDTMMAACAFAMDAYRARERGEEEAVAWSSVVAASRYAGWVSAIVAVKAHPKTMAKQVASKGGAKGGAAKAAKSAAMRETLRKWCEGKLDQYETLSALGDDAKAASIIDVTRETIGLWITKFAKDWRRQGLWKGR